MQKITGTHIDRRINLFALFIFTLIVNTGCIPDGGFPVRNTTPDNLPGADFIREAHTLFRIAACAGGGPIPEPFNKEIIGNHCDKYEQAITKYKNEYANPMKTFLSGQQPANLHSAVIYPFGGGDLLSAITSFPDATEFYTLSLELAGDIQRINLLEDYIQTHDELKLLRNLSENLLNISNTPTSTINTNENLKATQRGYIRGLITLALVALAIHEQEPLSLRYFRLEENGNIHYLNDDDITTLEGNQSMPLSEEWTTPDFSVAFTNYELRFKPQGQDGPIRVHRHIAANLKNTYFDHSTPAYKHLTGKGHVLAMTKGALYLLWQDEFSNIRDYLIEHADFMVSDSTGLSPLHVPPGVFKYRTYGRFDGVFNELEKFIPHSEALLDIFKRQPYRPMPYRYGYPDKANNPHMIFVHRKTGDEP